MPKLLLLLLLTTTAASTPFMDHRRTLRCPQDPTAGHFPEAVEFCAEPITLITFCHVRVGPANFLFAVEFLGTF